MLVGRTSDARRLNFLYLRLATLQYFAQRYISGIELPALPMMTSQRKWRKHIGDPCNFASPTNQDIDLLARTSSLLPKTGIDMDIFKDVSSPRASFSSSSSTARKRGRSINREEILRVLAKDALEAMRGHGLTLPRDACIPLSPAAERGAQLAQKKQRRCLDGHSSTEYDKENIFVRPQSPNSFYRKIGLPLQQPLPKGDAPRPALPRASVVNTPKISAPLPLLTTSKQGPCYATPDRTLHTKMDVEHPGSITPARVQAAKNLLSLMQ